jgi:rod shape-determining protein MreD
MVSNKQQGGIFILLSVLFAMVLMLVPLPDSLLFFRPELVMMTLIYWAMALPKRVGIGFAWCMGFVMDVLTGGALGVLAFAYAFVIYVILRLHLQLRQYPLWQQALSIMSLVLAVNLISFSMSSRLLDISLIYPAITSTLIWPFIYATLRNIRRNFNVN